jgi:hypothetical protein
MLGIVIAFQQSDLKSNPDGIEMINSVAATLYSVILGGEPQIAKNFITTLKDNEKLILQKLVQVV